MVSVIRLVQLKLNKDNQVLDMCLRIIQGKLITMDLLAIFSGSLKEILGNMLII
jgi:hypothetical protein